MTVDENNIKKAYIHVFDSYYIEVDSMNFTVVKQTTARSGKNKGNVTKTTLGYFGKLEDAVTEILENVVMNKLIKKEDLEITEAFEVYKKEFKKFEKLVAGAKKELKG